MAIGVSTIKVVRDIQYIEDNFKMLQYECRNRVAEVRGFLDEACGFKTKHWHTSEHLELVWLNAADGYVNGNIKPRKDLQMCDIHDLVNDYVNSNINKVHTYINL